MLSLQPSILTFQKSEILFFCAHVICTRLLSHSICLAMHVPPKVKVLAEGTLCWIWQQAYNSTRCTYVPEVVLVLKRSCLRPTQSTATCLRPTAHRNKLPHAYGPRPTAVGNDRVPPISNPSQGGLKQTVDNEGMTGAVLQIRKIFSTLHFSKMCTNSIQDSELGSLVGRRKQNGVCSTRLGTWKLGHPMAPLSSSKQAVVVPRYIPVTATVWVWVYIYSHSVSEWVRAGEWWALTSTSGHTHTCWASPLPPPQCLEAHGITGPQRGG